MPLPALVARGRCLAATLLAAFAFGAAAQEAAAPSRNIYIAAGQVRPAAPVQGDLHAAGGRVILDQPVGGDAALVGGSVDVRAAVGDDARVAGGDISIESSVGGELFATGGNLTLTRAATVAGAARLYGGNISIEGRIDGPLHASAQKVTINGEVRGPVHLAAGQIELGPQARLGAGLSYASDAELKRAEGAVVTGPITRDVAAPRDRPRSEPKPAPPGLPWIGSLLSFLALLACAAVLILVVPAFASQAADGVKTAPWLALAIGFAAVVAVPILAVLLFITILGIPLGIVVLALYPVLLLAGFLVGVLFLARLVPSALRQPHATSFAAAMGYFALALLAVMLIGWVPVAGVVLVCLLSLAGIGACVLELYGRRKRPAQRDPPQAPPVEIQPLRSS